MKYKINFLLLKVVYVIFDHLKIRKSLILLISFKNLEIILELEPTLNLS